MQYSSTREAFINSLTELAGRNRKIVLVCADSAKVIRADGFADRFPERFIDVGIAEQNAVACASGMASCGLVPFVATYAGFITMRACEQVRTFAAYPNLNVKMVGANGGIGAGEREGVTHQFFEDLGILRTIPGVTIVVPADASQVGKAVEVIADIPGPAYIRIGSGRDPVVFDEDLPFELGKIRILKAYGEDVAVFVNGHAIPRALAAAEGLKALGIKAMVVEVHTLKPLDSEAIADVLKLTGAAVTVEDHNIIGGLGSAVAEVIAERAPVPLSRIGIEDRFPESGDAEQLMDAYGLSVDDIMDACRRAVGRKERRSS
ncbi:MAG: transketolase C-terminal domain-containing protein [Limnochordia bacterium]|jgi:transketolase|nr:transketolase C-terminal domain-containing protein [Bacillota bacterium]HOB08510.1 transketolase C-terminal domain-containing protein [Limnochordia bacterium]NLH30688.1 transketolase [Bacillota bacterium]HPT93063.1 transketolase C-terminal domain-containing protein [Limnochordia bacterium]HPZ30651.1 transketolase C-terminal domain-containing protein [Limnochordia bacterium]